MSALLSACGSPEERAYAYVQKAQALFDEGDNVAAKIEAMNAAQIEPRNAEARFLLAEIEEKDQNFRQAIGHLQVAVGADPSFLKARLKLANYYVLARAATEASQQAEAALGIEPGNAEVRLLIARVKFLQEEHDAAMAEVNKALEIDPSLTEAIMFKAGILMNAGDAESAINLIDDGMATTTPDKILSLRQFRVILMRSANRFDDVEADLKELIRDYPESDGYALSLAQLYSSQDRIDEAEEVLRSVVTKDPTNIPRRIGFARFVAEKRGTDAAIDVIQDFILEFPDELALRIALGRLYELSESRDAALAEYSEIAAISPMSKEGYSARNRIAIIKIQENETDEAKRVIEKILSDDGNNSEALLVDAAFKFSERDYDDAISNLRIVLRSVENSERALLLLARAHVGAGNPELAQDVYRRLIELNPDHPNASSELAELLARGGDMRLAEDVLRQRLEVDPEDRDAASRLVQTLLLQGDIEAAETEVRNLLEFDDPTGLAEFQLGQVMLAKKSGPEAISAFKLTLEKNPAAAEPLQRLVGLLVEDGQVDQAVDYLDQHLLKYPNQLFPKYLLGSVYARTGDRDMARQYFEEVITGQPKSVRAYAALAELYPDDQETQIGIYRRGFEAAPENQAMGLLLATQYEQSERFDEALLVYEEILVLNAESDLAANNLAVLLLDHRSDRESHARALELAKRFTKSTEPALVDTLGWAYYRGGEFKSAVRYLEIAVAGADQMALLHYHLGMAYFAENDTVLARQELEKAVNVTAADYVGIEEARATLQKLIETAAAAG